MAKAAVVLVVLALVVQGPIYDGIPDETTKVMARRTAADHGDMLTYADGYLTAWFMWHLQGDENARAAFAGPASEIMTNPLYQDQSSNVLGG